jgi:hypothetical protein
MRRQHEPITTTLLFRLAQALLPGAAVASLFGMRLQPVRAESSRVAQLRRLAALRRRG